MLPSTHVALALPLALAVHMEPMQALAFCVGSVMPDKADFFISGGNYQAWQRVHRTWSHSWWLLLLLGATSVAAVAGVEARPEIAAGLSCLPWFFGGMLFHVFCDMFTPMGIPFLWPTGPRHGLGLVYSRGFGNLALCLCGFCLAGWLAWKQYAEGTEIANAGLALFYRLMDACGLNLGGSQ